MINDVTAAARNRRDVASSRRRRHEPKRDAMPIGRPRRLHGIIFTKHPLAPCFDVDDPQRAGTSIPGRRCRAVGATNDLSPQVTTKDAYNCQRRASRSPQYVP